MDDKARIKELEEKNAKLEEELQATKEHLKKYLGTMWCYYSVFILIISYFIQYYKIIKL